MRRDGREDKFEEENVREEVNLDGFLVKQCSRNNHRFSDKRSVTRAMT